MELFYKIFMHQKFIIKRHAEERHLLAGTKNGKNFHSNWQKTDLLFFDF